MDIRCERCGTEYEFDDNRVTEAGITVKCSSCGHMFKIRKKSFVLTEPVTPGAEEDPGAAKNWMIRKPDGQMLSFKELTTLQKWIVERKVSREDEISKSGESWKKLGSIAELASFFRVVDQSQPTMSAMVPPAAPVTQPLPAVVPPAVMPGSPVAPYPTAPGVPAAMAAMMPPAPVYPAGAAPVPPAMPSVPGMPAVPPMGPSYSQPGMSQANAMPFSGAPLSQPSIPAAPPSYPAMPPQPPAPAYPPVPPPAGDGRTEPDSWDERAAGDVEDDDVVEKWRRRGRRKWMVIVPLLVVALGAGAVYLLMPEKVHELWRKFSGGDEISALALQQFKSGMDAFMKDTPAGYDQAATDFQAAIAESRGRFAKAQAALAQVHLARMERAKDRIRAIESRWQALQAEAAALAPKEGKEPPAEVKAKQAELAAEKEKLAAEREALAAAGRQEQDAAERAIAAARAIEAESFEARTAQAQLLRVRGSDRAQIDVIVAELEKIRPQDPDLLFLSGAAAAADPAARDTAVRLLNAAIESAQREGRPDFLRSRCRLARVLIDLKRLDEAKVQLERILAQSPDHPEAKELLASLAPPPPPPEEKKPEEKKPEEKPAAPAAPADYDGWMAQANRLQERGRSQEALAAYQSALGFKPDDVEAQSGVGLCYLDMGNYSAAINAFRKALKQNPNYADAVMGLAEANRYLGNKDEARKYYQKYLDILPNGPEAAVARRNLEELK